MAKEIRIAPMKELRSYIEGDEMRVSGIAAVFDTPTVLWVDEEGREFREIIDRGAFDNCRFDKCCLKYNHESAVPLLARTRGGSMALNIADRGLEFDAKLFHTQTSRDIFNIVQEGGLDECSFAFSLPADGSGAEYDPKTRTRTIKRIEWLWDCAIVDNPAYNGTSVSARDFFKAEAEKEKLESLARIDRDRQILKIKILTEV